MNHEKVAEQTLARVGQCVMTFPTTACFNGFEGGEPIDIGKSLRFFGDGFQVSKLLFGRRFWRIPVMDGEFFCGEDEYDDMEEEVEDAENEGDTIEQIDGEGPYYIIRNHQKGTADV